MKYYLLVLSTLLVLASCGSTQTREEALAQVKQAEDHLYAKQDVFQFSDSLATVTIEAYNNFATSFPEDSLSAEYLFKAADLYRAQHKYEPALDIYSKIQQNYPNYKKVPQTIFLQGFVYENDVKDLEKAKERYSAFLEKYPEHELAKDVQFSLNNLGRSPEDIIKEFNQKIEEQKQNEDPHSIES